ncbi:hypothetical protein TNIN_138521 [Trichonephila inaurata madagascariensis]|uniref:Uncharacterized protein n=1 Tax=Trichonephila inaurata madagascariensis TaxID=2747483 RepID=A0A8X6XWC1_9ARAC|nr:hypothetical protein TNIN_138521 [Trichonephila inaurata madagascariensis]
MMDRNRKLFVMAVRGSRLGFRSGIELSYHAAIPFLWEFNYNLAESFMSQFCSIWWETVDHSKAGIERRAKIAASISKSSSTVDNKRKIALLLVKPEKSIAKVLTARRNERDTKI